MTIGLLNWEFHNNIGDDVMGMVIGKALEDRGHTVIHQGEKPDTQGIDAFFWGGGTLISQSGVFPALPLGLPIIGFGLGVCETPPSAFMKQQFENVKHVFARDIYSYTWFIQHNIPATLSFDPVFLLELPNREYTREYVVANIIASSKTDYGKVKGLLKDHEGEDIYGFSVGLPEDPRGCEDFKLSCQHFTDPKLLHEFLLKAKSAITTRLHATIFAYLAGVPNIQPVVYDPKVQRFIEYVVDNKVDTSYMRERLNEHIDYALKMLFNS